MKKFRGLFSSSVAWTVVAIPLVLLLSFAIAALASLALIYEQQAESVQRQNEISESRAVAERIPATIAKIQQDLYRFAILSSIGLTGPELTTVQNDIAGAFETLEIDILTISGAPEDTLAAQFSSYRAAAMQAAELIERSPIVGITAVRGVVPIYEQIESTARLNSDALRQRVEDSLIKLRERWRNLMLGSAVGTLILMLVLFVLSYFASRLITIPIVRLSHSVRELENGNVHINVPGVERSDELGLVARSVEEFRLNLIRHFALQRERDDLNRTLEEKVRLRTAEVEDKSLQLEHAQRKAEEARREMTSRLRAEFGVVVREAGDGNFGKRINSTFADGNLQNLAEDINKMIDAVDFGVSSAAVAVRELASEGVSPNTTHGFSGAFADMMANIEGTASTIRQQSDRLRHSALHDALTGLPNRRFLEERLEEHGPQVGLGESGMAFLHIDLDRFKEVNDTLGHAAGDEVLTRTSRILKDATGEADFLARVGGDEFVVVSPVYLGPDSQATEVEKQRVLAIADGIVDRLSVPFDFKGSEVRFGASVGIAFSAGNEINPSKLMIDADVALYAAKESGRNQSRLFTPELNSGMLDRKRLTDDLHRALEAGEFEPYLQPQVDATTFETVGFEALVRWKHPTQGVLGPAAFLRHAEEIGLVADIDKVVAQKAVSACTQLHHAGHKFEKLALNVSLQRLEDPDFIESIRALGQTPFDLSIELLETIFFDEQATALEYTIDQLKDMGVQTEIDDFGSGRASISSLVRLLPDWLKIDRSIIKTVARDPSQLMMVKAIVDMAYAVDVRVLAEGIEDRAIADLLRSVGCERFQGFAFGKPTQISKLLSGTEKKAHYG